MPDNYEDELTHVASKNVRLKDTHWLLPDILPIGNLVLLVGEPGIGKSTLCAALGAHVSRGDWGPKCKVFMASLEETAAHFIKPRMMAARAVPAHVFYRNEELDDFD